MVLFVMIIMKYRSIEDEVFVCKRDRNSIDWRKRLDIGGFESYSLINDAIYVPRPVVDKILPIIQNEGVGVNDCVKLFNKFRDKVYGEKGGRIFTISYDDSLSFSSEIEEISNFKSLIGFEEVF